MEINFLVFLPLLRFNCSFFSPHALGIKYFFTQALASIIFFTRILFLNIFSLHSYFFLYLASFSLLWKLGVPPFHLWLIRVLPELDWQIFFVLSSWQKVLPYFLMGQVIISGYEIFILLSLWVSALGSFFQSRVKKLLIFSSIFTRRWVMASLLIIKILWFFFLFLYRINLLLCISLFEKISFAKKECDNYFSLGSREKLLTFLSLASLAGLPPFLGFFTKIIILFFLINNSIYILSLFLVIFSVFLLFLYSSVILNSLIIQTLSSKVSCHNNSDLVRVKIIFISFFLGLIVFFAI